MQACAQEGSARAHSPVCRVPSAGAAPVRCPLFCFFPAAAGRPRNKQTREQCFPGTPHFLREPRGQGCERRRNTLRWLWSELERGASRPAILPVVLVKKLEKQNETKRNKTTFATYPPSSKRVFEFPVRRPEHIGVSGKARKVPMKHLDFETCRLEGNMRGERLVSTAPPPKKNPYILCICGMGCI